MNFTGKILSPENEMVRIGEKLINLTALEADILRVLTGARGIPLRREDFIRHIYAGVGAQPNHLIVDVLIFRIRRKLSVAGITGLIETVAGEGYAIKTADRVTWLQNLGQNVTIGNGESS